MDLWVDDTVGSGWKLGCLFRCLYAPFLSVLLSLRFGTYIYIYIYIYTLQRLRRSHIVVICKNKSYINFVIDPPLMMAQSRTESTRDIYNYGQYINQIPPNTIKAIREFERIQKEICRQKISIMFNEICINEEMLPIYIYIYTRVVLKVMPVKP